MTGKIEDMVADLIAELRHRLDELERRIASLELSFRKFQPPKRDGMVVKSKRRSR
jgi:BMFP domain-containing protein YqiC